MNQENPLISYRIKCNAQESKNIEDIFYDFKSGLWKDKDGQPIIKKYMTNNDLKGCQETLITESREGVDRSEISDFQEMDKDIENMKKTLNLCGETLITRTREGIDRASEISDDYNFNMQSTVTFTRESIDRSEQS